MTPTKTLARAILSNASAYEWSLQGMGLLRLHLPDNMRLHVWDSRYRVPGVSMVHDHLQWGLHSTVIAGRLTNLRYRTGIDAGNAKPYLFATLKPGYGCYFKHDPQACMLSADVPRLYEEGESYEQRPADIHATDAAVGSRA